MMQELSHDLIVTAIYIVMALCLIAPPSEFISVGLTIQNIFSAFLGSEEMNFSLYHIKRTTCIVLFHSSLPLGSLVELLF